MAKKVSVERMRLLFFILVGFCLSVSAVAEQPVRWKAVLIAGDDSAPVFDNAVDRLMELLSKDTVVSARGLTSDFKKRTPDRPIATTQSIKTALHRPVAGGFDACLVYMTSHGDVDGFYLREDRQARNRLTPNRIGRMLDQECGKVPTVLVVSACHSGVFIAGATRAPNRIILTAARDDRSSFGCGAEFELTYFDECVLGAWPKSSTWHDLFGRAESCVREKEAELQQQPSMPQAYFGDAVEELKMP